MAVENMIKVEVPEGFDPQSVPCDPATRIKEEEILIERVEEDDMLEIAKGVHASFPEIWWNKHEPASIRAEPELRARRLAKRMLPYARHAECLGMKAVSKSTGEIMGFAGWQLQSKPPRAGAFGHVKEGEEGWGFQKLMGWTDEELVEMWEGVNLESWKKEFDVYDGVRKEELGTEPHWYLAPFFVIKKFRGKGVGKVLMDWAIKQADEWDPPMPLYLEALPNARPVYMHLGFEGVPESRGPDRASVLIRRGPKKG